MDTRDRLTKNPIIQPVALMFYVVYTVNFTVSVMSITENNLRISRNETLLNSPFELLHLKQV